MHGIHGLLDFCSKKKFKKMTALNGLMAVFYIILTVSTGTVEAAVFSNISCYPNNTIIVTNPLPDTHIFGSAIDSDAECVLTFKDNYKVIVLEGCSKSDNIVVQLTEVNNTNGVLGGAGKVLINLMCTEIDQGMERNITQGIGVDLGPHDTANVNVTFPGRFYIREDMTSNPIEAAELLQPVLLTYDLPNQYDMKFMDCTAYSGKDTTSSASHVLITDDCSVDTALIASFSPNQTFVVGDYTRYYTQMTMFRFWVSIHVTIQCEVRVCRTDSNATCVMNTCADHRRRRAPARSPAADPNYNRIRRAPAVDTADDQDNQYILTSTTFRVLANPDYIFSQYMSASSSLISGIWLFSFMSAFTVCESL